MTSMNYIKWGWHFLPPLRSVGSVRRHNLFSIDDMMRSWGGSDHKQNKVLPWTLRRQETWFRQLSSITRSSCHNQAIFWCLWWCITMTFCLKSHITPVPVTWSVTQHLVFITEARDTRQTIIGPNGPNFRSPSETVTRGDSIITVDSRIITALLSKSIFDKRLWLLSGPEDIY